jgi:hypothetical protein
MTRNSPSLRRHPSRPVNFRQPGGRGSFANSRIASRTRANAPERTTPSPPAPPPPKGGRGAEGGVGSRPRARALGYIDSARYRGLSDPRRGVVCSEASFPASGSSKSDEAGSLLSCANNEVAVYPRSQNKDRAWAPQSASGRALDPRTPIIETGGGETPG